MYVLIRIEISSHNSTILVSKYKKNIIKYLKDKGYYYSKVWDRYISKKCNNIDYFIEKIKEI